MYLRPQEVMPGLFGSLPVVKFVAIGTILIYFLSKQSAGERVTVWPLEMKMMTLIWLLGLFFIPVAASPEDSFNVLFDPLIKTLLIFVVQINLVDTRPRFRSLLGLMVFCEVLYSLSSIKTFLTGGYAEASSFHDRIGGWGGMLANPNDIACVLALMLPFTVTYAVLRRGWERWFFFACVGVTAVAILFTYSRSGFLSLIASGGLIIWKLTRGRRLKMLLPVVALAGVLLVAMPGKYMTRLSTIFNPQADTTNSAQERQEQMKRAMDVAIRRPIVGVGMGNYHIYGFNELRAHNSYLETAAELGVIGLIAFLIIIFVPMRSLRRIERETAAYGASPDPEKHIMSMCLQASFVAFIIYGFFGSVQYDSYLYSLVAFAVALRRIHVSETDAAAGAGKGAESPVSNARTRPPRGLLWSQYRFRER
jgi:O-antigen ligase